MKTIKSEVQVTEEELRELFADTLERGVSRSIILISYQQGNQVRTEVGVPYSLSGRNLEMGPYLKDIVSSPPRDYSERKKKIPVSNILRFTRIELSDIL